MRVRVFVFDEFTDAREAEVNDIGDEGGFGVFPFLFPLGIGECGFLFMNPPSLPCTALPLRGLFDE